MEISKTYLENLKKRREGTRGGKSERQELIQKFVDQINAERVGTEWKPVSWGQINGLLRHLKEDGLYRFYGNCAEAASFSKCFFGVLKSKKVV